MSRIRASRRAHLWTFGVMASVAGIGGGYFALGEKWFDAATLFVFFAGYLFLFFWIALQR